jgi:predicted butyrate kinase (DUF1464 family)
MKIKKARKTMRKVFEKDPEFKATYIANVAMHLYDHIPSLKNDMNLEFRNKLAEEVIDLIFQNKIKKMENNIYISGNLYTNEDFIPDIFSEESEAKNIHIKNNFIFSPDKLPQDLQLGDVLMNFDNIKIKDITTYSNIFSK